MSKKDLKEAKRAAVAGRIKEMQSNIDLLTGMLDERALDVLIVTLGIGHVVIGVDDR